MTYRNLATISLLALSLPAMSQDITLKIAHFLPSASPVQQKILQPWCEEIKQASKGRITCQFYPAMQLGGTPAQLVDQVKNGVADVVWTAPGYSTGRFPAIEAFELPFMVADASNSSKALWKYYQQNAQAEFSAYKVLAFHTDGGQAIHTSKKEITDMKSIIGMKSRSSTRLGARTLSALNGSPVAMPPAQLTEAIAKGVVDGSFAAWELVYPTKLSEVTKFHAQPANGTPYPTATVLTVLMNKAKYDDLPTDLKTIIDNTTGEVMVNKLGAMFDEVGQDSRQRIAAQGDKITTFDAGQIKAMKQATMSVEEEWKKQITEKGLDGQKLIDSARELTGTQ